MPTKVPLQPAEERLGHPAEIPHLGVLVLPVVTNGVGKDVSHLYIYYLKPSQELLGFLLRVHIRDRTPFLRLGITRYQLINTPELAFAIGEQDPQDFPGIAVIYHDL